MDSKQARFSATHLTALLAFGGLVGLLTISCGSNGDTSTPPVDEPQEAGVVDQPDVVQPAQDSGEVQETGPFLDAGPCVPQPIDCTGKCGPVRDACSGEVKLCGGCPTGEVCDLELHTCGTPKTKCADFGAECGQVKTSCGKYISCGSCPAGKECNPDTNKCQPATVVTCQDLGYECGNAWLGSGDPSVKTNCGNCTSPQKSRCNAVFNVCEPSCTPPWIKNADGGTPTANEAKAAKKAFCDAARQNKGVECGIISDGCGGVIDCSLSQGFSCPAGQGCGVRGVANRCEPFPTPPECETLGKNCGTITSTCDGSKITCGVCTVAGEVCNDNGICGPPCKSKTCQEALPAGQQCGTASDGCKGTLNCGCPGGQKCLAAGTCCQPKLCSQLVAAGQCGKQLDDGCGGKVDCNCAGGGKRCVDSSNKPVSNGTIGLCCVRKRCNDAAPLGYAGQCGQNLDDGCGGTIDCGCGGGQSCIVGGPPGNPAPNGTPGTCCAEANCAAGSCNTTVPSVCITGQNVACDTCTGGQVCNGTTCCTPSGSCGNQCGTTVPQGCGLPDLNCGCTLPFTCNAGTCTCDAYTCSSPQYAGKCGTFDNGCFGTINCDPCGAGQTCFNQACCTPKTCGDFSGCGYFNDGCGHTLDCTTQCTGGQVCNTSSGACCTPATCPSGFCGSMSDGCGGNLNCNPCGSNQTCVGNTCCTKFTCSSPQYAGKCGNFPDNCGGTLTNCNPCTGFNTCGGGGVPNECGCTPKKAPQDCAGKSGPQPDGCGGTMICPA